MHSKNERQAAADFVERVRMHQRKLTSDLKAQYDFVGSHVARDSWVSVLYPEGLNSAKSSGTLQRTDRHGIVGQKSSDFQRFL